MAYSPLKRARSNLAGDAGATRDDDTRTSYTSEFLESVAELPIELKKSFSLIKDLDEYMHEMMDGSPSTDQPGIEQMKTAILLKVNSSVCPCLPVRSTGRTCLHVYQFPVYYTDFFLPYEGHPNKRDGQERFGEY